MALAAAVGAAAQDSPAPAAAADDEIVLIGRNRRLLRNEIERIEHALFERFNALNADDELDIRCTDDKPLGSNIPRRQCVPQFVVTANAAAAYDVVGALQGSAYTAIPDIHFAQLQEKGERLKSEMARLVREDGELLAGLQRLVELKRAQ